MQDQAQNLRSINTGLISTAEVPIGGVKQPGPGPGREVAHQGIDDYVKIKYLCLGDILDKRDGFA